MPARLYYKLYFPSTRSSSEDLKYNIQVSAMTLSVYTATVDLTWVEFNRIASYFHVLLLIFYLYPLPNGKSWDDLYVGKTWSFYLDRVSFIQLLLRHFFYSWRCCCSHRCSHRCCCCCCRCNCSLGLLFICIFVPSSVQLFSLPLFLHVLVYPEHTGASLFGVQSKAQRLYSWPHKPHQFSCTLHCSFLGNAKERAVLTTCIHCSCVRWINFSSSFSSTCPFLWPFVSFVAHLHSSAPTHSLTDIFADLVNCLNLPSTRQTCELLPWLLLLQSI